MAQRGCEVSLCGDTQNLTAEGPGQAAQAELLDQMILRSPFKCKGFFCARRKACEEREYLLLGLVRKLENSYFGPHNIKPKKKHQKVKSRTALSLIIIIY